MAQVVPKANRFPGDPIGQLALASFTASYNGTGVGMMTPGRTTRLTAHEIIAMDAAAATAAIAEYVHAIATSGAADANNSVPVRETRAGIAVVGAHKNDSSLGNLFSRTFNCMALQQRADGGFTLCMAVAVRPSPTCTAHTGGLLPGPDIPFYRIGAVKLGGPPVTPQPGYAVSYTGPDMVLEMTLAPALPAPAAAPKQPEHLKTVFTDSPEVLGQPLGIHRVPAPGPKIDALELLAKVKNINPAHNAISLMTWLKLPEATNPQPGDPYSRVGFPELDEEVRSATVITGLSTPVVMAAVGGHYDPQFSRPSDVLLSGTNNIAMFSEYGSQPVGSAIRFDQPSEIRRFLENMVEGRARLLQAYLQHKLLISEETAKRHVLTALTVAIAQRDKDVNVQLMDSLSIHHTLVRNNLHMALVARCFDVGRGSPLQLPLLTGNETTLPFQSNMGSWADNSIFSSGSSSSSGGGGGGSGGRSNSSSSTLFNKSSGGGGSSGSGKYGGKKTARSGSMGNSGKSASKAASLGKSSSSSEAAAAAPPPAVSDSPGKRARREGDGAGSNGLLPPDWKFPKPESRVRFERMADKYGLDREASYTSGGYPRADAAFPRWAEALAGDASLGCLKHGAAGHLESACGKK